MTQLNYEMELDSGWKLQHFEPGKGVAVQAQHPHYDDSHWTDATVPGDVHSALAAGGTIGDPYAVPAADLQWIERHEWWYRTLFAVKPTELHEHVELLFEGLDTLATVYLNGMELGTSRNAFRPVAFDVSHRLSTSEPNLIAVRFDSIKSALPENAPQLGALSDPNRVWIRKPAIDFGWSFVPRLITTGITAPVCLNTWHTSRILDSSCTTTSATGGRADVALLARVETPPEHGPMVVEFTLSDEENQYKVMATVDAEGIAGAEMDIPRPRLWWTHDLGEPFLYTMTACLFAGGKKIDEYEQKVGLRTIELVRQPDAENETFRFRLNGVDLFCRGANWLPADCLASRLDRDRYRSQILAAVDANMNMLRVWGGGRYESEVFYDLCDEQGVLVWQDFMFAAAEYPESDDAFVSNCRNEAEGIVRRLMHHPCIALWCGNDECQWRFPQTAPGRLFSEILPEICDRLTPQIPYWPGSPTGGPDPNSPLHGDYHDYGTWARLTGGSAPSARFVSAIGAVQSPEAIEQAVKAYAGEPDDAAGSERLTELCRGESLKLAAEHYRRIKADCSGLLLWHFNDCRPGMFSGLLDYSMRRTPAYHYARRFFQPVIASARETKGDIEIWISNDTPSEFIEPVKVSLLTFEGEEWWNLQLEGAVGQWQSECILRISRDELPQLDPAREFIAVTSPTVEDLRCRYFFFPLRQLDLPRAAVHVTVENFRNIMARATVSCDSFVRFFSIELPGERLDISDNLFDLLPGESRIIHIRPRREFDPKKLLFKALNAEPIVEYVR